MIKDGESKDYCWRQCVESMLPVCDVVNICVASVNDDDTEALVREWVASEPKLRMCIYTWVDPVGDIDFFVNWIQYARLHTLTDYVLELDADEVLHENSYETITKIKEKTNQVRRASYQFQRYNFWRDASHIIPHGVCCGHAVVRLAPQNVWLPSDGIHPNGQECIMMQSPSPGPLEIMHYGFIRKPEAFFRKARALQGFFFNSYDPRLEKAEMMEGNWMENCNVGWEGQLIPFTGTHPERMKGWLEARELKV